MFFILAGLSTLPPSDALRVLERARLTVQLHNDEPLIVGCDFEVRPTFRDEFFGFRAEPTYDDVPDDWLPAEVSSSRDFALLELRQGPVRKVPPQARPPPRLFNLYV